MEILLVEDSETDAHLFITTINAIRDSEYYQGLIKVAVVHSIKEAEESLKDQIFDVILLDLNLPDAENLEGLAKLVPLYPQTPIIIYTGLYDNELAMKALEIGAQDYIVKGALSTHELIRAIIHAKKRHAITLRLKTIANES